MLPSNLTLSLMARGGAVGSALLADTGTMISRVATAASPIRRNMCSSSPRRRRCPAIRRMCAAMDLRGSNVIVTGASTGIGRATALLLAQQGAAVLAVARDEARLKELAGEQSGINVFAADITDDEQRAALVEAASPVDVLINNAGLGYEGLVEDTPMERVRQLFELNVFALIDLTQRVLPSMVERGAGHIVNVGSVSGYVSHPP